MPTACMSLSTRAQTLTTKPDTKPYSPENGVGMSMSELMRKEVQMFKPGDKVVTTEALLWCDGLTHIAQKEATIVRLLGNNSAFVAPLYEVEIEGQLYEIFEDEMECRGTEDVW